VSAFEPDRSLEGHTLTESARARGVEAVDLALWMLEQSDASLISFNMREEDIELLMRQPWTMTASDGDLTRPGEGMHPRGTGTFPRKIRRYALERGTVSLEDAIRSMTSLPATVFRVPDRGAVRPGAAADLVVFDLERVEDRGTYRNPHELAAGMVYVFVNGELAIEGGALRDVRRGRVIQRGRMDGKAGS
jgi:N-acyl-D-aspartate/D-glutamate deacylase